MAAVGYQLGNQIDYENRQRDFNRAKMDAEQVGLQDAASAAQSANQLRTAQNTAELGLVPARARLAGSQIGLQQGQADIQTELQPATQDIARKQTSMQSQKVGQDYLDFGNKLRQDRITNAISQQDANDAALTKLADVLHTSQSPQQAVQFYNAIVDTGALGDMPGPKATDVRMGKTPDGREEIAFFSGDKRIFGMDQATMGRYLARGQKVDIKDVKPGHSLVGVNSRTGTATELYKAPETQAEKLSKQPAEVATMEWMVQKGVAKDANEAFEKLRTSRAKGKAGFIADMMKNSIMPKMKDEEIRQLEDSFGAMYDRLNGGSDGARAGASSNSSAANRLDPKVQSLFE
ncbi:hypothetical protein BKK79_01035 [Cupriavidus sp. USMAA2-4]|nr:hypothetical protein BKK79_01035 [Cupriavidus sp. USMAA2-4]